MICVLSCVIHDSCVIYRLLSIVKHGTQRLKLQPFTAAQPGAHTVTLRGLALMAGLKLDATACSRRQRSAVDM